MTSCLIRVSIECSLAATPIMVTAIITLSSWSSICWLLDGRRCALTSTPCSNQHHDRFTRSFTSQSISNIWWFINAEITFSSKINLSTHRPLVSWTGAWVLLAVAFLAVPGFILVTTGVWNQTLEKKKKELPPQCLLNSLVCVFEIRFFFWVLCFYCEDLLARLYV